MLDPSREGSDWVHALEAVLAARGEFLAGCTLDVDLGGQALDRSVLDRLFDTLSRFPGVQVGSVSAGRPTRRPRPRPGGETTIHYGTLRNGQVLRAEGHLVVAGDVNVGARVEATGDVVVAGCLRGVAHAGLGGNEKAIVYATRLRPTQLRIARVIGAAASGDDGPDQPEVARLEDGRIVVEAARTALPVLRPGAAPLPSLTAAR